MDTRTERRAADEASLAARYERARCELAPQYMDRHRLTRVGLADVLGVDRSALSRFLNGVEGYTPSRTRPGKIEILERIEAQCCKLNVFTQLKPRAHGELHSPDDDLRVWFDNFLERIVTLEEKYEPATALLMLPELCAQATSAPAPYGASMATNLLLPIIGHVDRPEIADASPELLRHTVARVRRLEAFALERGSETFRRTAGHKPVGYAGYALAMIGVELDDDELIDDGLQRLERAATTPHAPEDYHWPNLLMVLERLLAAARPRARSRALGVAARARTATTRAQLGDVFGTHAFDAVRELWHREAPELMRALDVREGPEGEVS